jgi:4-amino-4-deoxy-L-arabinose transferase-like glycosyltransferase
MHVQAEQHAEGLQGLAALPKVWLLLIGLILLWLYGYRISTTPLFWEEPRRCLVALEMIYRGDYVVPYVLGEPYRNKPPLQNWLIVLFAGNQAYGVGPVPIRLISLLSLLGISWCLWQLARGQGTTWPAWLPVLIFLTMGIVIQYGRSGELDALFTFWIVAALYCFEAGRRRQSSW